MEPSNENIDQYTTIQSITPEELENPEKSKIIKYLQYLSILFSILFSIAGMYYFLKGENKISPTIIQNNITKETIITQQVNSNVPKKLLSCVRYENDSDKKRIIEENLVNVIDKCPFKNQVN